MVSTGNEASVKFAASIDPSQKLPLLMGLQSKLTGSTTPSRMTKLKLRIMTKGFVPDVAGDFASPTAGPPGPGAPPPPEVTRRGETTTSLFSNLLAISLKPSEEKSFNAFISIPASATPPVGSTIMMRAEYWHDGVLAEYGPPACAYIAHPLPALDCRPRSVLVFCHGGFMPEDYGRLERFFNVFKMRACFFDYGHYATPVDGKQVLSTDDKWASYLGASTIILCNNGRVVTQNFDKRALMSRLAEHVERGGALISTPDFKPVDGNTRAVQTNEVPFGLAQGTDSITSSEVQGQVFTNMTMSLISTRSVGQLLEWLKGEAPLDMVIQRAGPLQRFTYQQEFVKASCCPCFGGGSWLPASVLPDPTQYPYTLRDAVYETLALYLEEDLRPFGGADQFVLDYVTVKVGNKQPPTNFPAGPGQLSKINRFVALARSDPALKPHLLAVLWAMFPLNLDLTTTRNPSRPQKFGKGRFYGESEVTLNPGAQTFWKSLKDLVSGSLDQNGVIWTKGEAIKQSSVMRKYRESTYGSQGWITRPDSDTSSSPPAGTIAAVSMPPTAASSTPGAAARAVTVEDSSLVASTPAGLPLCLGDWESVSQSAGCL